MTPNTLTRVAGPFEGGRAARRRPGAARRALLALAGVVAAWAVAAGCHLLRVDVLMLPLILFGTAGLLRGGRSLLDRVMLAVALLFGAAVTAGLLFTVWPWGLHPVAVGGAALSALVLVAAAAGRAPRLPRPTLADAATVSAATLATSVLAWPFLRRPFVGRMGLFDAFDDWYRHFALFDTIRWGGGYVFLRPEEVATSVPGAMAYYPQGGHLVYALLDTFVRGDTEPGPAELALDHFVAANLANHWLMALAAAWAVVWIGGAWLGGWRYLVPLAAVAVYTGFGEPVIEFALGRHGSLTGIALMVLLLAVLARPLRQVREQLLVVAALVVALGFSYYLYLPVAGLAVLIWLVRDRRRLRRAPLWTAGCALAALTLAAIIPLTGVLRGGHAEQLGAGGAKINSRDFVVALALAVAVGVFSRRGRRLPAWRGYAWFTGALLVFVGAFAAYVHAQEGSAYYLEKSLNLLAVVLLVGVGSLALLGAPPRSRRRAPLRERLVGPLPAAALAVAIAAAGGVFWADAPYRHLGGVSYGRWYAGGKSTTQLPIRYALRARAAIGDPRGSVVVVLAPEMPSISYFASNMVAVLDRSLGRSFHAMVLPMQVPAGDYETLVKSAPRSAERPLRLAVVDPAVAATLEELQRRRPDLHFVVYRI